MGKERKKSVQKPSKKILQKSEIIKKKTHPEKEMIEKDLHQEDQQRTKER